MKPQTLPEMLRDAAQKHPDNLAFSGRNQTSDYKNLDVQVDRVASSLLRLGIRPNARIALVLDNVLEYVVAYYATLRAGCVAVPLCPDTRTHTLVHALRTCEATAAFLAGPTCSLLSGQRADLPGLDFVFNVGETTFDDESFRVLPIEVLMEPGPPPSIEPESDSLAAIIFTSGTTAKPKGVMLSHRNLVANTRSIVEYLRLRADDRVAMLLPFFYSYGNSVLHTHIAVGASIIQVGSITFPAAVLRSIQDHQCTGLPGVPSTFIRLVQSNLVAEYDLSSLRYLTQAGGPMSPATTQRLRQTFPSAELFVMYGQTEATARLSYLPSADVERKLGSIGVAIPGVKLRVLDPKNREVAPGEVGEIVATGDNIMMGYWNNPEESARVLRPEGLRTGDLAKKDEDGYLFIVGRESDMIKSGAHRIGPKEIEEAIMHLPEVAECAVVGIPDDLLGEAIAAFVVLGTDKTVTEKEILRICLEQLPRFKVPAHVRFVAHLPRTDSGKVRRDELKKLFRES